MQRQPSRRRRPGTSPIRASSSRRCRRSAPTLAFALLLAQLGAPCLVYAETLVQAAKDGNQARALALIEDGADVAERGHAGDTALHWAAFNGQLELARRLIAGGAPINARVRNGNTPLHQAAYAGHLEMARLLLAAGADLNALDARGATPAGWAERNGHQQVLGLLRERGGRVEIGDNVSRPSEPDDVSGAASTGSSDPRFNAGLSRRMGELPSVVLRVPSNVPGATPTLSLSRDIRRSPPAATTPITAPATTPAAIGQRPRQRKAWLQLGSFRRERDAGLHRKQLLSRYQDLLGDRPISIVAADVEGRGRFHRVRAGPLNVNDAQQTCHTLKSRGAKCLLVFTRR